MDGEYLAELTGYLAFKLPLSLDVGGIAKDLAKAGESAWGRWPNDIVHDGGWEGIWLRNRPELNVFCDTKWFKAFPSVKRALNGTNAKVGQVILSRIKANSAITPHADPITRHNDPKEIAYIRGTRWLNICLTTNPDTHFFINRQRVPVSPGEIWIPNIGLFHSVYNLGPTDRVHLLVELLLTPEAESWIHNSVKIKDEPGNIKTSGLADVARAYLKRGGWKELPAFKNPEEQDLDLLERMVLLEAQKRRERRAEKIPLLQS